MCLSRILLCGSISKPIKVLVSCRGMFRFTIDLDPDATGIRNSQRLTLATEATRLWKL